MTPDELQLKIWMAIGTVLGVVIIAFFVLVGAANLGFFGMVIGIVTVYGLTRMLFRVEALVPALRWLFPWGGGLLSNDDF